MIKEFKLQNKIILLTGSEGNLGKFLVNELKKYKTKLILIDVYKKKIKKNKKIDYYSCDFNDKEQLNNLISLLKKKYKRIDIIINNAALTTNIKSKKKSFVIDNFEESLRVNLDSAYKICMALRRNLNNGVNPCILNVSSMYSVIGPDLNLCKNTNVRISAGYNASKAGIVNLSKWMANYLAPRIRVNAISPGGIYRNHQKKFLKNYVKRTPLKRMAKENDIVKAILFLISDYSSYITGHNLVIDGGFSIK